MANRPSGIYHDWSITYGDAGGEMSTMRGSSAVIEEGNIETQDDAWLAFRDAVDALALGDIVKQENVNTVESGFTRPTNGANRETKLLIQYQNISTGKRYAMTLPTLDPTIPVYVDNINAKDAVRMDTPAAITTLITTFEAFVVDPQVPLALQPTIGWAVEVVGLQVVGRNI